MATTSAQWMLGFAAFFTLAGLACVAVSFSTDYWIVTTVDRDQLEDELVSPERERIMGMQISFSRNRGLFRTCFDGNDTVFLDELSSEEVSDGNCVEEKGYELNRRSKTNDYPNEYDTRIHLLRSHFAFFITAMVFLVIGILTAVVGCWRISVSTLQIGGLVVFVGAFFAAAGMAMFHGYDYLEREKLDGSEIAEEEEDFPAWWMDDSRLEELDDASKREYGWSYILGWISVGMSVIGAILFLCASFSYRAPREPRHKEKEMYAYDNNPYPTYPASSYAQGYGYGY